MALALGITAVASTACGPRRLDLPTTRGAPFPDAAAFHAEFARACAGVRTLTAELSLSGRAGDQRLRGRALAGFQAPDGMRLEGLAPFGAPAFILAARDGTATLLLPRDDRVLKEAPPEAILGALTGVALAPGDLQAILSGCVVAAPRAVNGWQHGDDWRVVELQDGVVVYFRRAATGWTLRAARREGWEIQYDAWSGRFPRTVRLLSARTPVVDVTAGISGIETNVDLDPAAFTVDVPPDAISITLDELRDAGPLRGSSE